MKTSNKIWLAVSGILLIILGIMCICNPFATMRAAAWIIGFSILTAGICKLIFALRTQSFLPNSASRVISSILLIILGILFLSNIFFVSLSLPILLSVWILVESIIITIQSFDYKKGGLTYWWVISLLGTGGILLGISCLRDPSVSTALLSLLAGISLILMGVAYLVGFSGVSRIEKNIDDYRRESDDVDEQ